MRQLPSDKYNVAWFKLAEFISRGEKERALGIYRLLMHSFDDRALALQLEGDILLSFNDEGALERYEQAAEYYQKDGKATEAALVHEHIVLLKPDADFSMKKLIDFYEQTGNKIRLIEILDMLSKVLVKQKKYEELAMTLGSIGNSLNSSMLSKVYKTVVINLCQDKYVAKEIIMPYLQNALNLFAKNTDGTLNQFMETLKATREDIYQEACNYLKKESR